MDSVPKFGTFFPLFSEGQVDCHDMSADRCHVWNTEVSSAAAILLYMESAGGVKPLQTPLIQEERDKAVVDSTVAAQL